MSNKNNTIHVLLVSTSYPADGEDWRGRFIADVVEALSHYGEIALKTWMPPGSLPSNVVDATLSSESRWLEQLTAQGGIAHILRSKGIEGIFIILGLLKHLRSIYCRELDVDVLHINWLQNALPLWGNKKPAIIVVLGSDYKLLQIPGMTFLLRQVLKSRKSVITPNAQWMTPLLEEKFGDIADIRHIPFGVHQRWLNIVRMPAQEKRIWMVVSRLTHNKIGDLFEWGKSVFTGDDELHLLGPNQEEMSVPSWVHYHGATHPAELESKWFPRASGLITLSRHDEGRPQIVIEAMAAGLPVIASDHPAHRDVICHQKTGWLVRSEQELAKGVQFLSDSNENCLMGSSARKWIANNIGTWQNCAKRYAEIYHELAKYPLER